MNDISFRQHVFPCRLTSTANVRGLGALMFTKDAFIKKLKHVDFAAD